MMLWAGLLVLLSISQCQLDGQVTKVLQLLDMDLLPLLLYNQSPNPNYYSYFNGGTITPQGQLSIGTGRMEIVGLKEIRMDEKAETHWVTTMSYASTGLTDGASGNPAEGCLMNLLLNANFAYRFGWAVTDTKVFVVYAVDYPYFADWFIPVADIEPGEVRTYEMAISKRSAILSFRIDNKEVLRLKGSQGIDPKFRAFLNPNVPITGRTPKFTSALLGGDFYNLIKLGNVASNRLPCLDATYDQCVDHNPAFAPHTHCTYIPSPPIPPDAQFDAKLDQIQFFLVEPTKGCDKERLPIAPWRPCPCKQELSAN